MKTDTISQFERALKDAVVCARTAYPDDESRIERALSLALAGHVTMDPEQHLALVMSSDGKRTYTVNGTCTCADFTQAGQERCKHRYAKSLVAKAHQIMARRWYATVTLPCGSVIHGVAEQCIQSTQWLVHVEDGSVWRVDDESTLVLGGNVGVTEAQACQDGALWEKCADSARYLAYRSVR